MLKRFSVSDLTEFNPMTNGEKVSCLIPVENPASINLMVRCENPVDVNVITEDGQTILLDTGKLVRYNGKLEGCSAVEIAADTTFWYSCQRSAGWFEKVDPTPMQIELTQSKEDILRLMIDERLQAWKIKQGLNRELSEDEKDELILDIAAGDLEFDDEPDDFGLGYEERLAQFVAEQNKPEEPEAPPVSAPAPETAPVPPAAGSTVRST